MAQLAAAAQMTDRPTRGPSPYASPSAESWVVCSGLSCADFHDKARVYLRLQPRRAGLCPRIRLPEQLLVASRRESRTHLALGTFRGPWSGMGGNGVRGLWKEGYSRGEAAFSLRVGS